MDNKAARPVSRYRRIYLARLAARCAIFLACLVVYFVKPEELDIISGSNFFKKPSIFHLLWLIWMGDMLHQLVPVRKEISLGSLKVFKENFRPAPGQMNYRALKDYIRFTTRGAYKVLILWTLLLTGIGVLYWKGIIGDRIIFLISVAFYVCDLICVLIWCPFRLLMKTRCCTTCRIFNWDHAMMFTPMMFVKGFYSYSLLGMALLALLVWELCILIHPERFWEQTNAALQCANCTDKICTQYCQKLR